MLATGELVRLTTRLARFTGISIGFSARGITNQLSGGDYLQLLAGGAAAAALWAALGVGVGALVRNQVGALIGLCTWMLLVESVTSGFVPGAARLMPGGTGLVLAGNEHKLSASLAALLLILYATAAAAAGSIATVRRDVT